MLKRSPKSRRKPEPQTTRPCDWPGCSGLGEHRAPKSHTDLNSYNWYCLAHIREFNKRWNYYEGMSDEEIEADLRYDVHWRRPSWNFGTIGKEKDSVNLNGHRFRDPLGLFDHDHTADGHGHALGTHTPEEARAFHILDLAPPVSNAAIKARYKKLAKRHHPDVTNGDKAAEEKFKEIAEAYRILRPWMDRNAVQTDPVRPQERRTV